MGYGESRSTQEKITIADDTARGQKYGRGAG